MRAIASRWWSYGDSYGKYRRYDASGTPRDRALSDINGRPRATMVSSCLCCLERCLWGSLAPPGTFLNPTLSVKL